LLNVKHERGAESWYGANNQQGWRRHWCARSVENDQQLARWKPIATLRCAQLYSYTMRFIFRGRHLLRMVCYTQQSATKQQINYSVIAAVKKIKLISLPSPNEFLWFGDRSVPSKNRNNGQAKWSRPSSSPSEYFIWIPHIHFQQIRLNQQVPTRFKKKKLSTDAEGIHFSRIYSSIAQNLKIRDFQYNAEPTPPNWISSWNRDCSDEHWFDSTMVTELCGMK
jgi:hypothetical protein